MEKRITMNTVIKFVVLLLLLGFSLILILKITSGAFEKMSLLEIVLSTLIPGG